MSFFPSLMGDFDDDPFMGHMRHMNRMMNSFFNASPFGGMMGSEMMPFAGAGPRPGNSLMPFGFPDMNQMFQNNGNCQTFASSTITTMSNGPDGQPQVYQASQSVRSGPGGVKETKKSVADSRSGIKKLAIGHHIGDRAHIIEREQNVRSGEQIENQEYINLDEEEAPEFNEEWQQKARSYSAANAISYPGSSTSGRYGPRYSDNPAILPPPSSSARSISRHAQKSKSPALTSTSRTYRSRPKHERTLNYPALPSSSSRGRHEEREDNDDDDDDDEDDDDDDDCGVKIVEVEDDEEEGNASEQTTEPTSVIYLPEDTQKDKCQKSRGKKRSHEPDSEPGHKSQKFQNRP